MITKDEIKNRTKFSYETLISYRGTHRYVVGELRYLTDVIVAKGWDATEVVDRLHENILNLRRSQKAHRFGTQPPDL